MTQEPLRYGLSPASGAKGAITAMAEPPPTSYYTPDLIQCTLPHSDPKVNPWVRKNGNYSLVVSSGFDENGKLYGIPYGSFPRLVLAYMITRVIETRQRRLELTSHFGGFLREIGYTGNHKGNSAAGKRTRDQLFRLLSARFTFGTSLGTEERGQKAAANVSVTSKYVTWWDFKRPDQESLWGTWIELGDDFYNAILSSPVPLRTDILANLRKSPLALDVYMWLSYRLFTMQVNGEPFVTLSYGRLQEQFGTGIAEKNYRQFRRELKLAFAKVAQYWITPSQYQQLHYELHETGLTLYPSTMLIAPVRKEKTSGLAERILANRDFDKATRQKARLAAGPWPLDDLMGQYFEWIEAKGIIPDDPRSHFLDFIKTHRKRNGDPA